MYHTIQLIKFRESMVRPHWKLDKMTTANVPTLPVLIATLSFGKI